MTFWRSDPRDLRSALLAAARHDPDPHSLAALFERVDHGSLLAIADQQGIGLRVSRLLIETASGITQELHDRHTARREAFRAQRLATLRVIELLRRDLGVPFLVVKGPVSAARLYTPIDDREFNDLDILVERRQLDSALNMLHAAGAEALLQNWAGFLEWQVAEVPLRFGGVQIDLHWDLVALGCDRRHLRLDVAAMFARSTDVTLGTVEIPALDPTDELLHRCVNVGLDGARRLRGLVDIDRIVRNGVADDIIVRARTSGASALCAAVLERSRRLLGTELPDGLLDSLSPWPGWPAVTAAPIPGRGPRIQRGSIASGVLLSAGRDRPTETTIEFLSKVARFGVERLGRTPLTEPGGALDWQRPSPVGAQRHYLDWVGKSDGWRRRRVRNVEELERRLGRLEPRSTPALGSAAGIQFARRRVRADVWESAHGDLAAVLVRYRWSLGQVTGYPVVLDRRVVSQFAAFIDWSNITDLAGFDADIEPLRGIARWLDSNPATATTLPAGFDWPAAPASTRAATRHDLAALTDLMWHYAPHGFPTRWLLRRRVRRAIADLVLVLTDDDEQIIGMGVRHSATQRYHTWESMVITPAARGQGRAWDLVAAGTAEASRCGVGLLGFAVASNPMPLPDDVKMPATWWYVRLRAPRRVRGERRLRAFIDSSLRSLTMAPLNDLEEHRTAGRSDTRFTERRSQRWWREPSNKSVGRRSPEVVTPCSMFDPSAEVQE